MGTLWYCHRCVMVAPREGRGVKGGCVSRGVGVTRISKKTRQTIREQAFGKGGVGLFVT